MYFSLKLSLLEYLSTYKMKIKQLKMKNNSIIFKVLVSSAVFFTLFLAVQIALRHYKVVTYSATPDLITKSVTNTIFFFCFMFFFLKFRSQKNAKLKTGSNKIEERQVLNNNEFQLFKKPMLHSMGFLKSYKKSTCLSRHYLLRRSNNIRNIKSVFF